MKWSSSLYCSGRLHSAAEVVLNPLHWLSSLYFGGHCHSAVLWWSSSLSCRVVFTLAVVVFTLFWWSLSLCCTMVVVITLLQWSFSLYFSGRCNGHLYSIAVVVFTLFWQSLCSRCAALWWLSSLYCSCCLCSIVVVAFTSLQWLFSLYCNRRYNFSLLQWSYSPGYIAVLPVVYCGGRDHCAALQWNSSISYTAMVVFSQSISLSCVLQFAELKWLSKLCYTEVVFKNILECNGCLNFAVLQWFLCCTVLH